MVLAYLCWLSWPFPTAYDSQVSAAAPFSELGKGFLFGFILLLDIIHDISAIGNRLSVERDWIPVLVGPVAVDMDYGLTQVNSVLVRLDLICKLVAPSLLPLVVHIFTSQTVWIFCVALLTVVFWVLETHIAHIIARENPRLSSPKPPPSPALQSTYLHSKYSYPQHIYGIIYAHPVHRLRQYFAVPIWPASIAIALLQLTVLAYSATLITYLLEIHFSLVSITTARASGAIFALASTVFTPIVVSWLRKREKRKRGRLCGYDEEIEVQVVQKVGFWGVAGQFFCLVCLDYIAFYCLSVLERILKANKLQ
jgi:iron-regulated transporter 1